MRVFLVILAISSFLAKDIASFSWQTWFYIHQQEIAKEKCENKAIPMLHCNGKCYLSKQLKKLEQKEQNHKTKTNPFQKNEKVEITQKNSEITLSLISIEKKKSVLYSYKEIFSKKYLEKIFHPPTA